MQQPVVAMAAGALALATAYLCWRVLAERLLTPRSTIVVVLVAGAFAAAWVTVLRTAGVQFAALSMPHAVAILTPALLPLLAGALAPWSLGRIRHT